ncbi:DUF6668 family protein [Streptomyces sp. NPDC088387]|uniref:DUF6668 family protein n=1 Tax=Streptomyces sp. NPDC088387 TaxID=3365859 RepID=UPI00381EE729
MRTDGSRGPEIWIRGPVPAPPPDPGPGPVPGAVGPGRVTPRRFSWVGTHGGAGVSTLAEVYGGHDCGRAWPGADDPASVLLVARTHAAGLDAVARTLAAFRNRLAPAGVDLDAVVLVADAPGRLPRRLERRIGPIEDVVDVYRVPWVPAWRFGERDGGPPRGTRALARLTGAGR